MTLKIYRRYQRYFVVLGAFLIQLSLGSFYAFGNIQHVIVDYMQNKSISGKSVTTGKSTWVFGMMAFGLGATLSLGGFLERKIGPSLTALFGGWLMSLNVCLMNVTLNLYLSVVIISYGLIAGFGMGLAYGIALGTPLKWFPNNKGLILGIAVSGFGMSATIFDSIQRSILYKKNINVTDCLFDCNVNVYNLPNSFCILGSIYAAIQIIGSVLLKKKSDDDSENHRLNSNSIRSETGIFQDLSSVNSQMELEPHQIILELDFWILWMIMFLNSFCVYFITPVYSRYLRLFHVSYKNLTSISVIAAAFNCFGRIFWGYIIDKKPFKIVMLIVTLTGSVFLGTLPSLSNINESMFIYVFGLWITIIYFFNSGNFCIFPAMCAKLFGIKNFVCNYGLLFTSCSVSGFIVSVVVMIILPDKNVTKSVYHNLFYIGCATSVFAALLTLLFRGKSLIMHNIY